ncbi:hypothetical protein [Nocardia fluminea]|uniref:hypothetical protein n=1 Tax=Nocardia fluminea TaxID=134984 RepID=UPI0037A63270
MTALGFAVVIGLPLLVLFGTIMWPEPVAPERTVEAIRARLEAETERNRVRRRPPPWSADRRSDRPNGYPDRR